jgi:hypothetical protein
MNTYDSEEEIEEISPPISDLDLKLEQVIETYGEEYESPK